MVQQKKPTHDEVAKTIAEALANVKPGEDIVVNLGFTEDNPFYWARVSIILLEQHKIACNGIIHDGYMKFGEYTVGRNF